MLTQHLKSLFLWAHENPTLATPLIGFIAWLIQNAVMLPFNNFFMSYTPEQLAEMQLLHPKKSAIIKAIKAVTGDGAKLVSAFKDLKGNMVRIFVEQSPDGSDRVVKEFRKNEKVLDGKDP